METRIIDHLEQPDIVTCQSAAIAKVLGTSNITQVRRDLTSMGVAGDPSVMGAYMRTMVNQGRLKQYIYNPQGSLKDLENWVTQGKGYEAIIHGFYTPSGHVIGVENALPESRQFVVDDPWYEFDYPSGSYTRLSGKNNLHSYLGIFSYCVASWSPKQARELYRKRFYDMETRGMWLHMVQN